MKWRRRSNGVSATAISLWTAWTIEKPGNCIETARIQRLSGPIWRPIRRWASPITGMGGTRLAYPCGPGSWRENTASGL